MARKAVNPALPGNLRLRIDDPHAHQRIDTVPFLNVHLNPRSRDETVALSDRLFSLFEPPHRTDLPR